MKHLWNKISSQKGFLYSILVGLGFLLVATYFILSGSLQYSEAQIFKRVFRPVAQHSSVGIPVRLRIPTIQVDAPISMVGLSPDGNMGAPNQPDDLAWFGLGPRPGEKGSAVIAGHYGWKNGIPAAFDDLRMLHRGDILYVEDENGKITSFIVREIYIYGEHDDASAVFNSTDGGMHLNLITCSGSWDASQKSYSNRIVVFTDMEIRQD